MSSLTNDEFLERARRVHPTGFSYLDGYVSYSKKIKIKCETCGNVFFQLPGNHLRGQGCPNCKFKKLSKLYQKSTKEFINQAEKIHKSKYNYNEVEYINDHTKVKIFCKKCKQYFYQKPNKHLNGHGCPNCNGGHRHTTEYFKNRAVEVHGDKYNYDETIYINNHTNVKIFCNKCKQYFYQLPVKHLDGSNCTKCNFSKSKGEEFIAKYLTENEVPFIRQKRFQNCKDKQYLPFDFYLPNNNICIEFQGLQHYEPEAYIKRFKSKEKGYKLFQIQVAHDEMKRTFCKKNKIFLLEIVYNDDIKKKLDKFLKKE